MGGYKRVRNGNHTDHNGKFAKALKILENDISAARARRPPRQVGVGRLAAVTANFYFRPPAPSITGFVYLAPHGLRTWPPSAAHASREDTPEVEEMYNGHRTRCQDILPLSSHPPSLGRRTTRRLARREASFVRSLGNRGTLAEYL